MICDPLEPRTLLAAARIMPLGDSITEGWPDAQRVTYRFWLWKRLELAGYDVDFVGSRTGVFSGQPLYTDWDQNHQGLSGWRADEVAAQATSWANAAQPDLVLLHAGTNDLLQNQSVSSTVNEIKQIIDNLRVARPNVDIFLCKIIPSTINASAFVNFNNQVPGIVSEKDTPQSRVIMVDQFTGFSATNDEFDGIHPNARGERKMSARFYASLAASGLLPAPTPPPPPAVTYLSDLNWVSMTNGFGPAERDQSIGPDGADDGGAIWLSGVTYAKGLGTHARSEIVYDLGGAYARFRADVGIDDDAGAQGSAVFEVWVDNVKLFDSGLRTGNSPTLPVTVDVAGKNTLKLVVADGGNGEDWDHGDWANARLTTQPTVASSSFAYATAPHRLAVTFRGNVSGSLGTDDLLLENLTTSQTVPPCSMSLAYNTGTNTATFTFPAFEDGVLPDGRYRATVRAAGITDNAGNPMPADHVINFLFLVGDANNDGAANLDDFNVLAANFGQSGRDFTQGDFNYDGLVNLTDFNLLAGRFGATVAPAGARGAAIAATMPPTESAWTRVSDMVDSLA
jgi:lysophospholipase L1-like esterase